MLEVHHVFFYDVVCWCVVSCKRFVAVVVGVLYVHVCRNILRLLLFWRYSGGLDVVLRVLRLLVLLYPVEDLLGMLTVFL